jgi:hypothetical protein
MLYLYSLNYLTCRLQLENSGDPPSFSNARNLSFYECIYVIIVTMTTVGYGDVTCQTALGRGFIMTVPTGGHCKFQCVYSSLFISATMPNVDSS